MIGTVLRVGWLNLKRDRVAQALTFLLPVVFFSIFAGVFGGQQRGATSRVRLAVVDEDGSEASRRLVSALEKETALRVRKAARPTGAAEGAVEVALDRARAEAMVRDGELPVALVIPSGFGAAFGRFEPAAPKLQLLADHSDPIAPQIVQGLLQKAAMTGAPDLVMKSGLDQFERRAGALTPQQRAAVDAWLPRLKDPASAPGEVGAPSGFVAVEVVDVMRQRSGGGNLVAFYAAGTGVMFLLFMCAATGGSLLEEMESGTLERVLGSRLGMGGLLAGKWLFVTLIGILQIVVMFVWGALVFELPLLGHLPGFVVMTVVTAAAAAGFGLVLAAASRSRAQLSGISTIVILVMSAVGGSMFPRFLMSEAVQKAGLLTFNGWALDGYIKVFWRSVPVWQLWPQVLVLAALTVAFLAAARLLARRWETV